MDRKLTSPVDLILWLHSPQKGKFLNNTVWFLNKQLNTRSTFWVFEYRSTKIENIQKAFVPGRNLHNLSLLGLYIVIIKNWTS